MPEASVFAALGMAFSFMLVAGQSAFAQDVTVVGPPVTYTATIHSINESGEDVAKQEEKTVEFFRIFAQTPDGMIVIRTDGGDEYVSKDELLALLPELALDKLPVVDDIEQINQGAQGERVIPLQEALISLKLLEGKADGVYGPGTAEAVKAFQTAHNLESTGNADRYTAMLLISIANGLEDKIEASSKPYESPAEKFPQIADKTDGDLNLFMEPKWRFHFDKIEKIGDIDPSLDLGTFEVTEPPIDKISGSASVKIVVAYNQDTNLYKLVPAVVVETAGAYRPYLQGCIVVGENDAEKSEGGVSTGEIDGVTLKEKGYVPLSREAISLFRNNDVQTIRLLGKNTEYELQVQFKKKKMKEFMEACEGLLS